jgi:two-component system response regulator YesN
MNRIKLAHEEGVDNATLKHIIEKNFNQCCIIDFAKTPRGVVELAEIFLSDIEFIDIHLPGINGIDAMKEIKKSYSRVIFIVLSGYHKFDYAKEAINLGVMEYLQKPVNHRTVVEVIKKAMKLIDEQRIRRSDDLRNKEKLELVVPVIEIGLISAILLQQNISSDIDKYKELLGLSESLGYMIILEYGEVVQGVQRKNQIGGEFKLQEHYADIRSKLKQYFHCVVGPVMSNKIVCFVPRESSQEDYEIQSGIIQSTRSMLNDLNQRYNLRCRLGIGSITTLDKLSDSYRDAANALLNFVDNVAHCKDLPSGCAHDDSYPVELEKRLFEDVKLGKQTKAKEDANMYFDFMLKNYKEYIMDVKLKVLEFVLLAERLAYESGGITYHFRDRKDYLPYLLMMNSMEQLRGWFITKIEEATISISPKKIEYTNTAIEKSRVYIHKNFRKEITLDSVSREVNMSPYYFSKLFKNVTGENFIEYVTRIRVETAKKLLFEGQFSVKEICVETGYADPNYFSRIFKKYVGTTPTEFREGSVN